jgi:hypothetical protein
MWASPRTEWRLVIQIGSFVTSAYSFSYLVATSQIPSWDVRARWLVIPPPALTCHRLQLRRHVDNPRVMEACHYIIRTNIDYLNCYTNSSTYIHSMKPRTSWQAPNRSASQIPRLWWNPKVHYVFIRARHWTLLWARWIFTLYSLR